MRQEVLKQEQALQEELELEQDLEQLLGPALALGEQQLLRQHRQQSWQRLEQVAAILEQMVLWPEAQELELVVSRDRQKDSEDQRMDCLGCCREKIALLGPNRDLEVGSG